MNHKLNLQLNPLPRRLGRLTAQITVLVSLVTSVYLPAALPSPVVNLRFSEGSGATSINSGLLSGSAALVQTDGFPSFTNNVPVGIYAPTGNNSAIDFGNISAGQGGRAADLTAGSGDGTLGALNAFTICGWLNARNLNEGWGGNRIAFALASPDGPGFDLVQLGNGALRIGINQWPDGANGGGPQSSTGAFKADPQTGISNWVFFAVTYDPSLTSGNVKYFFGSGTRLAGLDTSSSYHGGLDNGGVIESSGLMTLGNFNDSVGARGETGPSGGSRVFRGLMDEFRIYDRALDLSEVQQAQLNGALPAVPVTITTQPADKTVFAGQSATFGVQVSGSAPFTYQWRKGTTDIPGATDPTFTLAQSTMSDHGAVFRVKVSNAATPNGILSDPATLSVLAEDGHKVALSFSEAGLAVTNLGNLSGKGIYAVKDGYPVVSAKVPAGSFAPKDNISSVDFGGITAGQGGRAIDLTNRIDNTLGPLTGFTVTGWLNCRDLTEGWGGNRIAFALAYPNGPGFDLVQLASGALRLGVNQWPDAGLGGPLSSEGKITVDAETGAANWVFFAVTYDGSQAFGNVSYYFGGPDQEAQLDVLADYGQGEIQQSGSLSIGNFGSVASARNETGPTGGSRCFRGLLDEINVYNKVLTLAEIQVVQKAPAYKPAVVEPPTIPALEPVNQTVFAGGSVTFHVDASGTPPLSYQWWKNHGATMSQVAGATNASYTVAGASLTDTGDEFWAVVSNQANSVASRKALLTVLAEDNHKVFMSFSEGQGTTTSNLGNIGGFGTFVAANGFPVFTNLVPTGPFAPTDNHSAVDFGVIADGEGGRAIDVTTAITPTIGTMSRFTLTGWLNCRDQQYGWGGNRILYCQASPGTGGFDLVQEAGGVLWVGVNQWPDAQPNSPAKSTFALPADPDAGNENWVFFAFTYDGTTSAGNAGFYFGSPSQEATLDGLVDYEMGPVSTLGSLTIGNFSAVDTGARTGTGNGGGSRVFRGLIDEINVFNKVLSLSEIRAVQKAPAQAQVQSVKLTAKVQGQEIVISWPATSGFQLQYKVDLGKATWTDEPTAPTIADNQSIVRLPLAGAARFFQLVSR
jgi:hypothetical protein